MRVLVRYAGLLSEIVGRYNEEVELPDGARVGDLVHILAEKYSALANWLEKILVLVVRVNGVEVTGNMLYKLNDNDFVELSTPLFEGG